MDFDWTAPSQVLEDAQFRANHRVKDLAKGSKPGLKQMTAGYQRCFIWPTHRTFRRYEKYDILYLDEFGYAPFDADATKHLFRLVSARHRKRSILLAANTGFNNWKSFFPSEAQAVATVDRLIDQATILRFTGNSFRMPKLILG
jgi:DNA replication protein DnaC